MGKVSLNPIANQKMANFENAVTPPLNHRSHVVVWYLSTEQDFGTLTVKSSLNPMMTQIKTHLQNGVRRP